MFGYKFFLSKKQKEKLAAWLKEQYKEHVEEQRKTMSPKDFADLTDNGIYLYTGAIGGKVTYCFTPTSLGVITVVKYFDKEIDLSDYNMW